MDTRNRRRKASAPASFQGVPHEGTPGEGPGADPSSPAGVWAETEAERHSQAKDNALCVCMCVRAHVVGVCVWGLGLVGPASSFQWLFNS